MSSITKKTWKFFTVDMYDKEEEYLNEMAKQGWHFQKRNFISYTFQKEDSTNIVYRLDYQENKHEQKPTYLQSYQETGWKFIQETPAMGDISWFYFSKETKAEATDTDLHPNLVPKIPLLRKIQKHLFLLMMALFVIFGSTTASYIALTYTLEHPIFAFFKSCITVLWVIIIVLYSVILVRLNKKIQLLKKAEES